MATAPSLVPTDAAVSGATDGRPAWMDVDWRKHQSWIEVEGRPVNVIELGDGSPLVFVHGLSGCWQNWLEQLPAFARTHRVVALDLPGFGVSPMPRERISMAGYARVVDAVCEQLGITSAPVVGHSMGGFVSAEMAIAHPSRVQRLVLVGAAGLTTNERRNDRVMAGLRRAENLVAAQGAWLATKSDLVARRPRLRHAALKIAAHNPSALHPAFAAEQVRGSGKPGFVDAVDALSSYPLESRLGEISCPTLIVWGARDLLVPLRDAGRFESLITGSRKVVFENTGHSPTFEQPERFNRVLSEFLGE